MVKLLTVGSDDLVTLTLALSNRIERLRIIRANINVTRKDHNQPDEDIEWCDKEIATCERLFAYVQQS